MLGRLHARATIPMRPIIANGLCIRPFRITDTDAFTEAVRESVATVGPWLPWCRADYSTKEARTWIGQCAVRLNMGYSFDVGIFTEDGTTLLGGVAINQVDHLHNTGNLGYWVRESMQHRGIATRAALMMAAYGFDTLKLTRLEILAAEHNQPSRAVAEKLGATFECVARNRLTMHGLPVAAAVYSLIPGDL